MIYSKVLYWSNNQNNNRMLTGKGKHIVAVVDVSTTDAKINLMKEFEGRDQSTFAIRYKVVKLKNQILELAIVVINDASNRLKNYLRTFSILSTKFTKWASEKLQPIVEQKRRASKKLKDVIKVIDNAYLVVN